MTTQDLSSSKSSFRPGVFVFGGVQLLLALVCANWAWKLWDNAERILPANFWGALALMLFLFGIAQINLVGPLRELRPKMSPAKIALPYRLESQFGGTALAWPFLSIAFAFGTPVVPMIMFLMNVEGNLAELNLIWIGLTLMGILIGGATLYLGLQKLYQRLNGSETVVEVSATTVKPGESFSLFVQHTPGRLTPEAIQVKLVCRETVTSSVRTSGGKTVETRVLYDEAIQPWIGFGASIWQDSLTVRIPEGEWLTNSHDLTSGIQWTIEVITHIPNAPDLTESFVLTVDDPDLRALWEAEEAR